MPPTTAETPEPTDPPETTQTPVRTEAPEATPAPTDPPETTEAPTDTTPDTPTPSDSPADIFAWRDLVAGLHGPVDSVVDPLQELLFFPDDVPTPPDTALELRELRAGFDTRWDSYNEKTTGTISAEGTYVTDANFEDLADFFETQVVAGGTWELESTSNRTEDDGTLVTFFDFARPRGSYAEGLLDITVVKTEKELVYFQAEFRQTDVEDLTLFGYLSTMANDVPRPMGAEPTEFSIYTNSFIRNTMHFEIEFDAEGTEDVEAVVADIESQFPAGPYTFGEWNDPYVRFNVEGADNASYFIGVYTDDQVSAGASIDFEFDY